MDCFIERLSRDLERAESRAEPIPAGSAWEGSLTLAQAYETQRRTVLRRLQRNVLAGYKVGLTNEAAQRTFGATSPVYGRLFAERVQPNYSEVSASGLIAPRIEPEVAFRLGQPLAGAVSRSDAVHAIDAVAPAFELVDSRIASWAQTASELVADNAAAWGAIIGDWKPFPLPADICQLQCELVNLDGVASTGTSSAVLGDPISAVIWLAETLADHGLGLRPGDIVLSGSWCTPVPLAKEGTVNASFGVLGSVTAKVRIDKQPS